MPRYLPCLADSRLLLEASVVGKRDRLVEDRLELAGVVGRADRGLVRHGRGPDQVAPAQLDRIDAGDARGLVDELLEHIVGLGASGPAIG